MTITASEAMTLRCFRNPNIYLIYTLNLNHVQLVTLVTSDCANFTNIV